MTKYENETLQCTSRNEGQDLFDNDWQIINPKKDIKLNKLYVLFMMKANSHCSFQRGSLQDNCTIKEFLTNDSRNEAFTTFRHSNIRLYQYNLKGYFRVNLFCFLTRVLFMKIWPFLLFTRQQLCNTMECTGQPHKFRQILNKSHIFPYCLKHLFGTELEGTC